MKLHVQRSPLNTDTFVRAFLSRIEIIVHIKRGCVKRVSRAGSECLVRNTAMSGLSGDRNKGGPLYRYFEVIDLTGGKKFFFDGQNETIFGVEIAQNL